MAIQIVEMSLGESGCLERYAKVSIAFEVSSRFLVRAVENGLGGLVMVEEAVAMPYVKDYDAFEVERPTSWPVVFDVSRWGMIAACEDEQLVGGAVIAWNTPGVDMLESRDDLAVLWDLRVQPEFRGRGVGSRLFAGAEKWARERGCAELKVETQNVNVAACRFYARQGCVLRTIRVGAYPELPHEVQLIWHKEL